MKIAIRYMAQVKLAAGTSGELLELPAPIPVSQVLAVLAQHHATLRPLFLTQKGTVQPTLLLFLGDEKISGEEVVPRHDGDVLTILTPMAGG